MRVNIYSEEMTERVEIVRKGEFTGVRFYLELPVTLPNSSEARGPFIHHPGDDDSSAVTFWGKHDLRTVLAKALVLLNQEYKLKDRIRKSSEAAHPEAAQGEVETASDVSASGASQGSRHHHATTATVNTGGEPSTAPADPSGQTGHAGPAEAASKATGSPAPEPPRHVAAVEAYRSKITQRAFAVILQKARPGYPEGFKSSADVPAEVAEQIIFDLEDEVKAQAEAKGKGHK